MKTLLFIVLFTAGLTAQDKRFTFFSFTDPNATIKDGFNIGAAIDYQKEVFYFKAQAFIFPNLNSVTYTEFTGTPLGLNLQLDPWRIYTGLKLGAILRGGGPCPTYGFEAGIDYYLRSGLFFGLQVSRDYRTDGDTWEHDARNYWRNSGFIKIGVSW